MDLLTEIEDRIRDRHLLTHPFYTSWVAGTLPMEAMQEYARQYYAFESSFPRVLSALHSRSDRSDVRQSLLENLWDEEHGEANHAELWLRFAEGIGAGREATRDGARNEATDRLVSGYRSASTNGPVAAGVAAVYAYEAQVPAVAQAKIDGLKANYGIDDPATLAFFELHAELDVEHSTAERKIIEDLGAGHEAEVLAATDQAHDDWWGFLDAVTPGAHESLGEG
jgi:pyrroloquinoline-quinone synthase